jgi:acyl-CoA thioester hydrolase
MAHEHAVRVYYEDTDAGGIVYHANYLRFAERARTEWLRALGLDHPTLLARHGCQLTVRRCRVEFRRPARLDDALTVRTRAVGLGGARLDLRQEIRRDGLEMVTLEVQLALIGTDLRPRRLPPELRRLIDAVAPDDMAT